MDEDDFDLGGFDEAYSPDDFSQQDMDFASAIGAQTGGYGDDNTAQTIANYTAQPQVGMNRSNIIGTSNYDPTFAAALDISRGLDPTNNFGGLGGLTVPSYLRPQTPGNLVLNEAGDRMMYGSPVERFAQETLPPMIRGMQKIGIGGLLDSLMGSFTDAKNTLGKMGDAAGGLSLSDLFSSANPMSDMPNEQANMGTLDPSDRFLGDMSQQGARMNVTDPVVNTPNVNMGSIPQVSPTFDAFGNVTRDADISRFADDIGQTRAGIASIAPSRVEEVTNAMNDTFNTRYGDMPTSLPGVTNPNMALALQIQKTESGMSLGQAMNRATMELAKRKRLGVN